MKTVLLAASTLCVSLSPLFAGGEGWTSDFEAAKKQAAEEDKSMLVDFTGSDWCGWCIRLNEEVFQHDAFKNGVKDKFVLVELDYPQDKSNLSEEVQAQNEALKEKYPIAGYPTILLMDAEGLPFASTGYQQGGPEAYVAHLDELLLARTARDEALAKAAELEGVEKAKALIGALEAMGLEDEMVAALYGDLVEQIKEADPEDESGYVRDLEMKAKFAEFQEKLMGFAREQDHEGALAFAEETLAAGEFEGESKQQVALYKAFILAELSRFDDAIKALDEAKAIAPDSEIGGQVDDLKVRMEEARDQAGEEEEADDAEEGSEG